MRKLMARLAIVTLASVLVACTDEDRDEAEDAARRTATTVEESARRTATTVAERAEQATRLTATLSGAAEAPTRGDPDGTGTATVNIDATKGNVCYDVSVRNLDRPVGMHIHEAEVGKSGPIVVPLTPPTTGDTTSSGCVDADRTLLGRIAANPDDFYLNVHTGPYQQGAVRGQLSQ